MLDAGSETWLEAKGDSREREQGAGMTRKSEVVSASALSAGTAGKLMIASSSAQWHVWKKKKGGFTRPRVALLP